MVGGGGKDHILFHDDVEAWDCEVSGGRFRRAGVYVCTQLIHLVVQQKLTQHYKAIILKKEKVVLLKVWVHKL